MFENVNNWRMDDRRVALTEIKGYTISTVRLPMDHGYGGVELWYETMIFAGNSSEDLYCNRYTTHEQAVLGHDIAIQYLHDKILKEKHENV